MSLAGMLDPTKVGKYPVVLSDALLGRDPKETYTGIRYNHKPSSSTPAKARLKPDGVSDDGYDLTFRDSGGQYAYSGTRSIDDNKYVLVFDPTREVFVLHKIDSTFSMNITQTPNNNDPDSLRRKHPHLEGSSTKGGQNNARNQKGAAATAKSRASGGKEDKKGRDLPFPPKKTKPAPQTQTTQSSSSSSKQHRAATPDSDDDSSDDGLLQIEEPGGPNAPPASARDFSPAFGVRRFSDFVQQNTEEEDDADGEDDDDNQSIEHFTLPSPVNRQMEESAGLTSHRDAPSRSTHSFHAQAQEDEEESDEDADAEMEDVQQPAADHDMDEPADEDLEAELMAAFEEEQQDQPESDVSEEE
ncbi:RNA polymerase II transcription elongation factor-domain-containing protein [Microdochium trichocladiopsis]|uniref:RNA polymerase II transcription elongation factor-domain-containing protein n=1 Tax=Microdochium trichocladiopsis TaxID=1682393 RepID=A0A9P8YGF4_9PEZI|nr:RNA polymerase II transcription elongation factor-domain-containing protein [Microdochium trichocladiopsis]KAH7037524.1 RNA polymerase II transcription elongation factor-domain-containing protein [Microdochium trichocladiopsis]